MHPLRACILGLVVLQGSCGPRQGPATDGPPQDLTESARQFYEAYGRDLRLHNRGRLARYYDPNGAIIVLAGQRRFFSQASLDTFYRGPWPAPAYFAWDSLAFDSLSPAMVLVTGGFRWLPSDSRDTGRYIYASILQAADSGLVIRLEHETPAPRSP